MQGSENTRPHPSRTDNGSAFKAMHPVRRLKLGFGLFALLLAMLLSPLLYQNPRLAGDADEYLLMTIALATHGTPDVRPADIAVARPIAPEITGAFDALEAGLRDPAPMPKPGFWRGRHDTVQAFHFFAYPALAAIPFKLLPAFGGDPKRAFQIVNLAAAWLLGMILFRFLGSAPRALAGVLLFMLCGGELYWNLSSTEMVSAACLLSAFLMFGMNAPLRGGLLAGIAAMQNPTIVLALAALPFVPLAITPPQGRWLRSTLTVLLAPRMLAGLVLGALIAGMAPLYNLYHFGTPSLIAKLTTFPDMITLRRLGSMFFDLNMGMVLGVPGVLLMLAFWGWRRASWPRQLAMLLLCAATVLLLSIPALSAGNWNSGAEGIMRYAFWAAMPLLFVLLQRLRETPSWPGAALVFMFAVQAGAMWAVSGYSIVQFSPMANWVMNHYPQAYNPDVEVFTERLMGAEDVLRKNQLYQWKNANGVATKTLVYRGPGAADPGEKLCGPDQVLRSGLPEVKADRNWVYLNGPLHCAAAQ